MLHSVLVILASSGRVLFSKEWVKRLVSKQTTSFHKTSHLTIQISPYEIIQKDKSLNMFAGLITTVQARATTSLGVAVSYLQFTNEGILASNAFKVYLGF